ncbi:hypothetical protein AK812_SmicGene23819 [Symbiodinium microadriaticum]|uniref:Uncharacterized protein n=1 Tax=Symbiodinium microadriaticum TaxID=2951 RepID=A0A1Q9DG48_SYMMI|nr:hypothetical protein AK812_SmicGene23819 [Symbiodinium microadriaticum]
MGSSGVKGCWWGLGSFVGNPVCFWGWVCLVENPAFVWCKQTDCVWICCGCVDGGVFVVLNVVEWIFCCEVLMICVALICGFFDDVVGIAGGIMGSVAVSTVVVVDWIMVEIVVAAEFVAAEERDVDVATVVAEKPDAGLAAAVAAAEMAVDLATVVAGRPDAVLAAAVAAAKVDADVATVAAEKPDAGLAAAVAAATMNAVQATVVAWEHTHASMVPPNGKLASEAGP